MLCSLSFNIFVHIGQKESFQQWRRFERLAMQRAFSKLMIIERRIEIPRIINNRIYPGWKFSRVYANALSHSSTKSLTKLKFPSLPVVRVQKRRTVNLPLAWNESERDDDKETHDSHRLESNSKLYLLISLIPSVKLQEFRRHQFSEFALDFLMRILLRIAND